MQLPAITHNVLGTYSVKINAGVTIWAPDSFLCPGIGRRIVVIIRIYYNIIISKKMLYDSNE